MFRHASFYAIVFPFLLLMRGKYFENISKLTNCVLVINGGLLLIFQLLFNLFLIPKSQDSARSFLRNSEIDFFPFLIKSKKFIDTVSDLTIFIDKKNNNGIFENVYIQDNSDNKKTQIVLAQKGLLGKKNDNIFLILYSGKILNIDSKKTSIVNFEKTEFNLSRFSTKTILLPKIQEQKSCRNALISIILKEINKWIMKEAG